MALLVPKDAVIWTNLIVDLTWKPSRTMAGIPVDGGS